MQRLSRQEQQQLTKQKLLDAGEKAILRQGVYETSIRDICKEAGFTLGAFYSNFATKDDLLTEIVTIQCDREFAVLDKIVEQAKQMETGKVLSKISTWLRDMQSHSLLSSMSLEFELYAKHNPAFGKPYAKTKQLWHTHLAQALSVLFASRQVTPKIEPLQMAIGFAALWSGLAIEGSAQKDIQANKIVTLFLSALLGQEPKSTNSKKRKP